MSFVDLVREPAIHVRFRGYLKIRTSEDGASFVVEGLGGQPLPIGPHAPEFEDANARLADGAPLGRLRDAVLSAGGAAGRAASYVLWLQRLCRWGFIEFPLMDDAGERAAILPQQTSFAPSLAPEAPAADAGLGPFRLPAARRWRLAPGIAADGGAPALRRPRGTRCPGRAPRARRGGIPGHRAARRRTPDRARAVGVSRPPAPFPPPRRLAFRPERRLFPVHRRDRAVAGDASRMARRAHPPRPRPERRRAGALRPRCWSGGARNVSTTRAAPSRCAISGRCSTAQRGIRSFDNVQVENFAGPEQPLRDHAAPLSQRRRELRAGDLPRRGPLRRPGVGPLPLRRPPGTRWSGSPGAPPRSTASSRTRRRPPPVWPIRRSCSPSPRASPG